MVKKQLYELGMSLMHGLVQSGASLLTRKIDLGPSFQQESASVEITLNCENMKRSLLERTIAPVQFDRRDTFEHWMIFVFQALEHGLYGCLHFFTEILWLSWAARTFGIERGGVAAVPYLAGYSGGPEQSRLFNAVGRSEPALCKE